MIRSATPVLQEFRNWMLDLVRAAPVVAVLGVGLVAAPACLATLVGAAGDGVAAPASHQHEDTSHECPVPPPLAAGWLPAAGTSAARADAPGPDLDHALPLPAAIAGTRTAAPRRAHAATPGATPRSRLLVSARLRL